LADKLLLRFASLFHRAYCETTITTKINKTSKEKKTHYVVIGCLSMENTNGESDR
jgi:hypothetical protein